MKKAQRPSPGGWVLITLASALLLAVVGLPIAAVGVGAFSGGTALIVQTFRDSDTVHAIVLTLEVVAATLAFNTLAGVLVAWTLVKYRFPGKALLATIVDLPLSISPVVAGLAVVLTFGPHSAIGAWFVAHGLQIVFAPPAIVIATIFVTFPLVARETAAAMDERGPELEEAALVTGASLWDVLWRVTLPTVRVGILNGVVLCAARALGEFGAVSVVSGHIRGQTLTASLQIEALYNDYNLHGAFALSLLLVLITLAAILVRRAWTAHQS
jgi:sulfate transport system permease protein